MPSHRAVAAAIAVSSLVMSSSTALALSPRQGASCGTRDILQGLPPVHQIYSPPPPNAAIACEDNNRPTFENEEILVDDTYRFVIHYTSQQGVFGAISAEEAERAASSLRETMARQQDELGFNPPPSDELDATNFCDEGNGGHGGSDYFDVYITGIAPIIYGYAVPTSQIEGNRYASFLVLGSWILNTEGALEVTVAHEYFHCIQFGYDRDEEISWMESSAVWSEEAVYPAINDYVQYVPSAMNNPATPLDDDGLEYAHGIWPLFYTYHEGLDLVRRVWEACEETPGINFIQAHEQVLADVWEGGFDQAFLDFKGAYYDKSLFEDGDLYTEVNYVLETDTLPVGGQGRLRYTGGHHVQLTPSAEGGPSDVSVCHQSANANVHAKLMARSSDGTYTDVPFTAVGAEGWNKATVRGLGGDVAELAVVTVSSAPSGWALYDFQAFAGRECDSEDATPIPTPTPGGEATPTPQPTATPEGTPIATQTPGGPTATPGGPTPTQASTTTEAPTGTPPLETSTEGETPQASEPEHTPNVTLPPWTAPQSTDPAETDTQAPPTPTQGDVTEAPTQVDTPTATEAATNAPTEASTDNPETPAPTAAPTPTSSDDEEGGCACSSSSGAEATLAWLLIPVVMGLRRRR